MTFLVRNFRQIIGTPHRNLFNIFTKKPNVKDPHFVRVGKISPERPVPENIPKPDYYFGDGTLAMDTTGYPEIKTPDQIRHMRDACRTAANVLKACHEIVQEGITTDDIDAFVHDKVIKAGAYPSPLRYAGFPKSVCTSVNNVACHGIPDDRKLISGDIVNIDVTVFFNGYHGDCSKTFLVGNVDAKGRFLVESTEECVYKAIELCRPGQPFKAIGQFIERFAHERKLEPIPAYIGHGIGSYFHGPPEIYHFDNDLPGKMEPNITFTIEPILSLGGPEIDIEDDGWTSMTVDGALTAQFEHTILITENGSEILTVPD